VERQQRAFSNAVTREEKIPDAIHKKLPHRAHMELPNVDRLAPDFGNLLGLSVSHDG